MDQIDAAISELVLKFYLDSARLDHFNGLRADLACSEANGDADVLHSIERLISNDQLDAVFSVRDSNPHIKRLPILDKQKQIELLQKEPLDTFCLYPSSSRLSEVVGPTEFADRPFSRLMLLGAAQLDFHSFEMAALSRYMSDPRFSVKFFDYMGDMSIKDEYYLSPNFSDRDKISIQTFGIGFDKNQIPYLVVFNRYLSNLTAEHQQYWNSYRCSQRVPMCYQYYQSSVVGEWWENRSVRFAVQEEMRLINQMSAAIWSKPFFNRLIDESLPVGLTAFLGVYPLYIRK